MINALLAAASFAAFIFFVLRAATDFGFNVSSFNLGLLQFSKDKPEMSTPHVTSYNQSGGITAGTVYVNQSASYAWKNALSWRQSIRETTPIPTVNNNGRFDAAFTLEAGEGIVPSEVCFRVTSDVPVTQVWAGSHGAVTIRPLGDGHWCIVGGSKSINGFIYFSAKPSSLEISIEN